MANKYIMINEYRDLNPDIPAHAGIKIVPCLNQNCAFVQLPGGDQLFYSYRTPVGYIASDGKRYITNVKYSASTTRQISRWMYTHNTQKGVKTGYVDAGTVSVWTQADINTIAENYQLPIGIGG
jgi:hypothetical protein